MPRPTAHAPNESGSQDSGPQGVSWFGTTEDGRPLDINGDVIEGLPSVLEQSEETGGGQVNHWSGSTRENTPSPSIPDTAPPPSPTTPAGIPVPEGLANNPAIPRPLNPIVAVQFAVYRLHIENGQLHYSTSDLMSGGFRVADFGNPRLGFFQPTTGTSSTTGAIASFAHRRFATSQIRLRQNMQHFAAAGPPSSQFEETMRQRALQRDVAIMRQAHTLHETMLRHARYAFDTLLPEYEVKPLGCCTGCGHSPWEADVVLDFS